jgi:hypothetical protein
VPIWPPGAAETAAAKAIAGRASKVRRRIATG